MTQKELEFGFSQLNRELHDARTPHREAYKKSLRDLEEQKELLRNDYNSQRTTMLQEISNLKTKQNELLRDGVAKYSSSYDNLRIEIDNTQLSLSALKQQFGADMLNITKQINKAHTEYESICIKLREDFNAKKHALEQQYLAEIAMSNENPEE